MNGPLRIPITLFSLLLNVFLMAQPGDPAARKQGYIKKKDANNKVIYEGEFKDDKPVGKFKYYYPNDSVKAILNFKNAGQFAYAKLFHPNGKRMAEGKYVNKEIKDSVWTYYDEAGVMISKDRYKMGKKHGLCVVFLPDGKISEERNYKEDILQGEFKDYFDGVSLRSKGQYYDGKLDGRVVYYYPNGVEVAVGFYRNGLKVGPWIYKTESNKVREKELYRNGVLANKKDTDEFFAKSKEQMPAAPTKSNTPVPSKKPSTNSKKTQ
jgi:antitoxin component YwqK of YwqJK toxin-antitoxin module